MRILSPNIKIIIKLPFKNKLIESLYNMAHNYCLVRVNKLYEDLYEILEDEELVMDNVHHTDKIKYQIEKLTKSYLQNKITISKTFETSDECLEDLLVEISDSDVNSQQQGNTLLMFADENVMYEIIFMEEIGVEYPESQLNQLASISNVELSPIYGNVSVVKSSYSNGKLTNQLIKPNDIIDLVIKNFYHSGVMMNPDGTFQTIDFTGDNPNIMIGGNFKQLNPLNIFGLTLVGYNEEGSQHNALASTLFGKEIKGRLYVTTLCPATNKRFWGLSKEIIDNLLKLLNYASGNAEEKKKFKELNDELTEDKLKNPFFLIKKYCV